MMSTAGAAEGRRARPASWLPLLAGFGLAALLLGDLYTALVAILVLLGTTALILLPLTWSVPLLLLCIPLRFYVTYPGTELDVALTNFVVVGFGLVCAASTMLRGRPRLLGWERFVLAWVVWTLLSLAWTTGRVASLRGVFQWLMVFSAILASALCVLRAADPAQAVRRLLVALLALVAVWSIIGFVQVAAGLDNMLWFLASPGGAVLYAPGLVATKAATMSFNWRSGTDVQPFGPFLNAIEFGIFTAVGIGAAVAMAVGRTRLAPRWLVITALILAVAANVACLKATGWVAALVGIAVAFVTLGRSIRRVVSVSLVAISVMAGLLWASREAVAARLQQLALREGSTGATAEAASRPSIWLAYLDAVRQRPLVGVGVATANEFGPVHWTRASATGEVIAGQLPTENSYLTTLIETGAVGLALLLATLVGAVVRGVRLSRRNPGDPVAQGAGVAAIGIAALLAGNMTVDAFNGEILGVIMGVLVGIVVAAVRLTPVQRMRSRV
ncbi:MAG TPA: O-antigen ligase family protein [Gemmatimonadales bacterium]|jgi:O-antigen ligase|nr:O-antigen ligase family protein [Gemmatimonadales bacterium]